MGQIAGLPDPVNATDLNSLKTICSKVFKALTNLVNGNIQLGQNVSSAGPFTQTFSSSSTVITQAHNLQRVPTGIIVVNLTAGATLYAPQGTSYVWTSGTIYLQATAAVTAVFYIV